MAKIPTYKSQTNFRSGFRAPQLRSAVTNITKPLVEMSNQILDKKAATEGREQGFKDVNEGKVNINEAEKKSSFTIRGASYKEGARKSFVAKTKNDYETQLTSLYNEHKLDIEKFNKEKDKLRTDILKNTPSSLQEAITIDFDGESNKFNSQIQTNIFNREESEQLISQTNRLETLQDKIEDGIVTGDEDTEKYIAEYFDTLNSLYNVQNKINAKGLSDYSTQVFNKIINAEIMAAYKVAEANGEGDEFIKKLDEGGYKQFVKEFATNYGDEIKKILPDFESPSTLSQSELAGIVKTLRTEERELFIEKSGERTDWEIQAKNALTLYSDGIDPGFIFSREDMEKLGFKESTILTYENSFRIAELVYPTVIEAKSTVPSDNTTNLKALQKEYNELVFKNNKTKEDRERILILSGQIEGVNKILTNQKKFIADGDLNLLFDQAGISYDTSTQEGMKKFAKTAENVFGIDSTTVKVAPQSQLDADSGLILAGGFEAITQMQLKYGEYFERFINDSGLVNDGYLTVAQVLSTGNNALAENIFNAITNKKENEDRAKNIDGEYSKEGGALDTFTLAFDTEFSSYLFGNTDRSNDIKNSAEALWIQIYATTGDADKATTGVINDFNKNFVKFEHSGFKLLLPNTPDVSTEKIKNRIDKFIANPQKFGIHTGANFDINDFKEDFEDNTFDNYALAIDGGTLKILNKENAMFITTIYKKLPSGSEEFSYTNNINIHLDEESNDDAEIKDVVDIWQYDSNINNKKFTTVVNEAVAGKVTTYDQNKKAFDEQEEKLLSEIGNNVNLYEKYKAFDKNNDGNITGSEWAEAQDFQAKENEKLVQEPENYSTYNKIETLMEIYGQLNKPSPDESIMTISSDAGVQKQLQAISMFIKDGEMTDWILDYLSDIESFEGLKDEKRRNEVLANWKNNKDRKTETNPPTIMSPIMALYDYVRDLEDSDEKIEQVVNDLTFGQVLMGID
tara:strand:+ start:39 stop:2948 length:2910 start_codon:yes stop_codon:yes gene_type:complete